jgi:hypothetical protein
MVPVFKEAGVGHFENAADVAGFVLVEKEVGFGGISVDAVLSVEEPEGHERVEEIPRGARMEASASGKVGELFGMFGQLGEDAHFDGAEERLRGQESHADLHDVFGG